MFLPGQLIIDIRTSSASVETCPMLRDSAVSSEIYGQREIEYTHEHGSYTNTDTIEPANVGDAETCPTVAPASTFDPDFNDPTGYGDLLDSTETFSSPITRSAVLSDLPSLTWDDWETSGVGYQSTDAGELHSHLELSQEITAVTSLSVGGVETAGSGLGKITATRDDAQIRFRLGTPLACTLLYQVGSLYAPVYDGEPEEDYTWGSTVELVILDEATITVPQAEDYFKKIRLVGIRWHPWT